ncbi:MAG: hypothetical protein LBJ64_04960 [Deltaproteobacteria bacterium]|nr:hypothetical protein [Deltaproteobacteria bacterium]
MSRSLRLGDRLAKAFQRAKRSPFASRGPTGEPEAADFGQAEAALVGEGRNLARRIKRIWANQTVQADQANQADQADQSEPSGPGRRF